MSEEPADQRQYSRRDLLTKVPMTILGGAVLGVALGKPLISRLFRGRQSTELPEGSIFTPADDARPRT
jgi:hypothetical protein